MPLGPLSADERRDLIVSIGTHRGKRRLSPVEVAQLLKKAIAGGASPVECAAGLQLKGASQILRFLALPGLPEEVQHIVDWGSSGQSLSFTTAFELTRLKSPEDQVDAAEAALRYGMTSAEVRQLVQAKRRSGLPIPECVASVLKMRPQLTVRHVFVGTIQNEELRRELHAMPQQGRDGLLRNALADHLSDLKASGRLGPSRFTLVGGAELGNAIRANQAQLEARVNAALRGGTTE